MAINQPVHTSVTRKDEIIRCGKTKKGIFIFIGLIKVMHAEAHERDNRMQIYLNQRRSFLPHGLMDSGERGRRGKQGQGTALAARNLQERGKPTAIGVS